MKGQGEEKVKGSLVCPSHTSLTMLQQAARRMMVHKQSVNGMGEKEGCGGKGAISTGEGKEDRRSKRRVDRTTQGKW